VRHQPVRGVLAPGLTTGRRTAGLLLAATALVATAVPASSALAESGTAATAHSRTAPYLNPELPTAQRFSDLLGRMTLAEKIGQMTQAERGSVNADPTQIANLNLGSLLSGGGSTPTPNTPEAWADLVDGYQKHALTTRLHIPLLYGVMPAWHALALRYLCLA
jgi:beta-glucosidase